MNVTIKTEEIEEPICVASIKEEPQDFCQKGSNDDACFPSVEMAKKPTMNLWSIQLPPKKRKKLLGMKGRQLWHHLTTDVVQFCQENGLLASSVMCICQQPMVLPFQEASSKGALWKCSTCSNHSVPLRKGTWFEESELTLTQILWIAYMWVHEYSYVSMLHESNNPSETLVEWCTRCQDSCRSILESKNDPLGNLVEVYECKIVDSRNSKKKHKNDSNWVFFGVEQFSTKTVLVVAEDKKSKTIVDIFDKYILPDTTVFGSMWNAYAQLSKKDFTYLTTKKSMKFYDTLNQTELKTIEDLRQTSSRPAPSTNGYLKYEFTSHFCEYIYRKSLNFATDAYLTFIRDIAKVYKPYSSMDEVSSILPD